MSSFMQYGQEDWDDDLDYACLQHDKCLCVGETEAELLDCDRALRSAADRISNYNDQCKGWSNINPFCVNDGIVCAAQNVASAMTLKIDRGLFRSTPTCDCVLHKDKSSCTGSDGSYDSSSTPDYYGYYNYEPVYEVEPDYEPSPSPSPSLSASPSPSPSPSPSSDVPVININSPDSAYGQLEKFNLEMDWNPSSCVDEDSCAAGKIVNAFTFSEMTAKLVNRDQENTRCWDKSASEAKNLVVSNEVSKGTKAALECMFENSSGSNEELWRDVYVRVGSCTGMSPSDYFDTVARLYMSVGVNRIADDYGLLSHNGTDGERGITVDRDGFLDYLNERIGRKAWIECDPETRLLQVVLVCINPNDPYLIQDCTMDRNDPTSTNGIPCQGELKLPLNPKNSIPEACKPYLLSDPSPALDLAETRASAQSSSVMSSSWRLAGFLGAALPLVL
jgi:hypothetical protein